MLGEPNVPPVSPPPAAPVEAIGPVADPERIAAIDTLRGVAIFGIFMVNIAFFAGPLGHAINPAHLTGAAWPDRAAWAIVKIFFEMKFITLFSTLFGIGLIVQMTRAQAKNVAFVPIYLRRLGGLLVIGLIHALGLWYGDILVPYSIAGAVTLACARARARTLLYAGVILLALGLFCTGTCTALEFFMNASRPTEREVAADTGTEGDSERAAADVDPAAPADDSASPRWWELFKDAKGDPNTEAWTEGERIAYAEGPLAAALLFRSVAWLEMLIFVFLTGFGLRVIATFLIGAALMKAGFFQASRGAWHRRAAAIGFAVGLPLEIGATLLSLASGFERSPVMLLAAVVHYIGSLFLAGGYLGAVTMLVQSGRLAFICRSFAAVGRMALSNYLGQTVIATSIMYWWGLGLFGQVSPPAQLALVCAIFTAQVIVSAIWLRFFRMGPMEWLWRSFTYMQRQPLRRRR